jgi:hypothetical protein
MPLYVYRCRNNHIIQTVHSMTADPSIYCPDCGYIMQRKPQVFTWMRTAQQKIWDTIDENYAKVRQKKYKNVKRINQLKGQ